MTKRIKLTQGMYALIDDEDFELVRTHKWYAMKNRHAFYAMTYIDGRLVAMHRLITNANNGIQVDHCNGIGLDNRKSNLRKCNQSQNNMNSRIHTNNQSGFKGVSRDRNHWKTTIQLNGVRIHVGMFNSKIDAARAYDAMALKLFRQFAKTNFG